MPVIYVSHPCQTSMPVIHASHPCQSSMPVIHSHPCQSSMPIIHAHHPCQSSVPVIHASHLCQSSMPVIHASHPCQSSMPVMTPPLYDHSWWSMIEISSCMNSIVIWPTPPHTKPYQTIPYLQSVSLVKYHCNFNPKCQTAVLPFLEDRDCKPFSACLWIFQFNQDILFLNDWYILSKSYEH